MVTIRLQVRLLVIAEFFDEGGEVPILLKYVRVQTVGVGQYSFLKLFYRPPACESFVI